MKLAILGGSFDPPHLGHGQIIQYLLQEKGFDQVQVFPSYHHPFKKGLQSAFIHRIKMCHLAFDEVGEKVKVCEDEKSLSGYTVDLITHLKKIYPKFSLTFVLGSDLKKQIKTWKHPEKIKQLCDLLFLARAPAQDSPFMDISSSELRKKIKEGKKTDLWVATPVIKYIKQHKLYQEEA